MATDGTRCRQDDVAARARARELAVSRVNRARAQLGAGDALKAEQEIPRKFSLGYEMSFLSCRVFHFHDGRKGTAFLSHDAMMVIGARLFGYVLVERFGKNTEQCFWFFGIEVPTQIL